MTRTRSRWRVNWGAVSALATVAGVIVAFAIWWDPHEAPSVTQVSENQIELAASRPEANASASPDASSGAPEPPQPSDSVRSRSRDPTLAAPPRETAKNNDGPVPSAPASQSAERIINVGPVSTTGQDGGVVAGYIENNNPPPPPPDD